MACPGLLPGALFQIDKHVSPCSVVGQGRAANAAVDVGYPARRHLRAILIELRSCGSGSPAGKRRRYPGRVEFGSEGGVFLSAEVATRGRMGSAPTQPRTRRIGTSRSQTHCFPKTTPPYATSTRCRCRVHGQSKAGSPNAQLPIPDVQHAPNRRPTQASDCQSLSGGCIMAGICQDDRQS